MSFRLAVGLLLRDKSVTESSDDRLLLLVDSKDGVEPDTLDEDWYFLSKSEAPVLADRCLMDSNSLPDVPREKIGILIY